MFELPPPRKIRNPPPEPRRAAATRSSWHFFRLWFLILHVCGRFTFHHALRGKNLRSSWGRLLLRRKKNAATWHGIPNFQILVVSSEMQQEKHTHTHTHTPKKHASINKFFVCGYYCWFTKNMTKRQIVIYDPNDPWDWYIYLQTYNKDQPSM